MKLSLALLTLPFLITVILSIVGAFTAIILNIALVPVLYSKGSAIVWVVSEICVLLTAQFFVTKYAGYSFPYKQFAENLLYALPITVLGIIIMRMTSYSMFSLVAFLILLFVYYFVVELYIVKNQIVISLYNAAISRFKL